MSQRTDHNDRNITLSSINPAYSGDVLGTVEISSHAEIQKKVDKAQKAQKEWRSIHIDQRVAQMRNLYNHLDQHREEFIKRTSREMGMPLKLSCAVTNGGFEEMEWNINHAAQALSSTVLYEDEYERNEQFYEPYGVMACILPWNFPFPNFARSPTQALLAGNAVVIKYSEEIPLFSGYLEDLIRQTDFPQDLIQFIYGDGKAGDFLTDLDINYISFTGSTKTGQFLYRKAADKLIPVELELGGSSPGIVFEGCDLNDRVIDTIMVRRFANSGQFCSGLKRLIVHHSLIDEVVEKLKTALLKQKVGDPLEDDTDIGPLIAQRQLVPLQEQIQDALDKGPEIICGGRQPDTLNGAYYEPTILRNITRDMRVWREEVFGPALPVISFDTYDDAIALANDTEYGLSGFVFTQDSDLAKKAMTDIQTGSIQQNHCNYQRPENPFGGYKCSGIGRQRGISGFHHVSQIKVMAFEK